MGADQLVGCEVPRWGARLLAEAPVAHLGLLDDEDNPRVMPVTFALHAGAVWSAVDSKPKRRPGGELARVRFLRRRPQAALTVDRYDADWSKLAWVQLLGRVDVLEASQAGDALEALVAKYASYRGRPPEGPVLRLVPARALHWRASG
jgi:PPOX class probable F420-dependent enzyme